MQTDGQALSIPEEVENADRRKDVLCQVLLSFLGEDQWMTSLSFTASRRTRQCSISGPRTSSSQSFT